MNKRTVWIVLLVAVAFAAGYYLSSHVNTPPIDTVHAAKAQPVPAVITSRPTSRPTNAPAASSYILNTNTKKFHYPNCKSVKQMKEKNKKAVTMSRTEIINMGYSPCGNCHP